MPSEPSTDESKTSFSRAGRIFASILDYPLCCTGIIVGISLLALGGYFYPTWPSRFAVQMGWIDPPKNESQNQGASSSQQTSSGGRRIRRPRFATGGSEAILVVKCPKLFTPEGAASFRRVLARVEELDVVASVRSLDQAPPLNIFGLSEPVLPRARATPQRFEVAKKKAVQNPLVVGQLLSSDAATALVEISYDWIYVVNDSDCTAPILAAAKEAAAEDPSIPMAFHVTGERPLNLMRAQNNRENEIRYQLIGYGMITVMAILLFRGLSVVLVVGLAPILGVFWTLGMLRYFGLQDNPFALVILPVLLSLVAFADGVHMMLHIRHRLGEGDSPKMASKHTLAIVGVACFLTSITTAIDMGALTFAYHKVVREFGWSCILGVLFTWSAVTLVIPLVSSGPWGKRLAKGAHRDFLDQSLDRLTPIIRWVTRHDRSVSFFAIGLTIVLAMFALTLRPDDRRSAGLPSGSDPQLGLAHLDEALGGLDQCILRVTWDKEEVPTNDVLRCIEEVEGQLRTDPLIGHPLSIVTLLKALPGDGSAIDKQSMAELLPPPLRARLFDTDDGQAMISFRCRDLGTAAYKPSFERIEAFLKQSESQHPGVHYEMMGEAIWRWRHLYKIITDLASSLGGAAIVSFFVLGLAYRSLRLGVIAIIPNILPLLASATFMAITGMPLEVTSVCCFTICLGIAVDDTIHFLSRYQEEIKHGGDHREAIERSFQAVGNGMIMTTIVLVAGFSSVLFSEIRDFRSFGMLGVITFIIALACDLLLLPALLSYFDRPKEQATKEALPQVEDPVVSA
jgi:predicted RND superfamily exporter protein